jgi:hypothetical protein
MNPEYRPFTPHEKRQWNIEHRHRIIEYQPGLPQPNVDALLALSLVLLLKNLQEKSRPAIKWWEYTNAPESPPQNEDSEA